MTPENLICLASGFLLGSSLLGITLLCGSSLRRRRRSRLRLPRTTILFRP